MVRGGVLFLFIFFFYLRQFPHFTLRFEKQVLNVVLCSSNCTVVRGHHTTAVLHPNKSHDHKIWSEKKICLIFSSLNSRREMNQAQSRTRLWTKRTAFLVHYNFALIKFCCVCGYPLPCCCCFFFFLNHNFCCLQHTPCAVCNIYSVYYFTFLCHILLTLRPTLTSNIIKFFFVYFCKTQISVASVAKKHREYNIFLV